MKKSKTRLHGFSLVMVTALLTLLMCRAQAQETPSLKIGMITSVTGPMAPGFKGLLDAVEPTEQLVNQRGGVRINGREYSVDVVVEDDKSSPAGAIAAANKLIQDKVRFIIAPIFMPGFKAMTSVTQEAKVIRVEPMTGDPTLTGPYSFIAIMTGYYVPIIYEKLQSNYHDVKKIALIMPDDPGAHCIKDLVVKEIKKRGLEVVFEEPYQMGTQDFYPILTKALQKKPDAIECVASIVPWSAGIINQSRELGFSGPIFCSTPFGDIHTLNHMVKPDYARDLFHGAPDVLSDQMPSIIKEFRKLLEKQLGSQMAMENSLCLGALYPLLQAIEKANSFDTDKVVKAWGNMQSIDTIFGIGEMSGKELIGVNHIVRGPTPISMIDNGVVKGELIKK